jgi:uncharacterized protein (DUF58 family)
VGVLLACSLVGLVYAGLRPFLLAADLGLVLASLTDLALTPSPARLALTRFVDERVGLGREFERRVRVEPGRGAGLVLELREEFAPALEVTAREAGGASLAPPAGGGDPTGGPDRLRLPRAGAAVLRRRYRSLGRGVQHLGDLRLRLRGPLGLIERQARLAGTQAIAVEPALLGLRRTLRLAASERWADLGVRRLRRKGGQTEFESLRDYVRGDDPRLVDWKAFARHGRPIVRELQEERGQELIVLIDVGRRMGATSAEDDLAGWSKLDHALDAGLELAAVALEAGDRVGMAAFDDRLRVFVAPARGRRQLGRLREAHFDLQPTRREADLARALRELSLQHRRRALLAVLSDLADPLSLPRQRRALRAGSRRHTIVLATLDDPSIRRAASRAGGAPPALRAAALESCAERARGVRDLRRTGARVLDSLPADAAGPLLGAWLDERCGAAR